VRCIRSVFLLALAVAFGGALPASGQVGVTAQDRSVAASSQSRVSLWQENQNPFFPDFEAAAVSVPQTANDSEAAPGAGPFDATASTADPTVLFLAPAGSATASQISSLGASGSTASGSFSAVGHSRTLTQQELAFATGLLQPPVPYDFGMLTDHEQAGSDFSATFQVSSPTPYTLDATVAVSALQFIVPLVGFEITSASASVELVGPSGVVASVAIEQLDFCGVEECFPGSDSVQAEGILDPGSYTLEAHAAGSATGTCTELPGYTPFECHTSSADGSFSLSLALGSPPVPSFSPPGLALLAAALGALGIARCRQRSDRRSVSWTDWPGTSTAR
jgi:hypothetical protein